MSGEIVGLPSAQRAASKSVDKLSLGWSALAPKADMQTRGQNVRYVPEADIAIIRSELRGVSECGAHKPLNWHPHYNDDQYGEWAPCGEARLLRQRSKERLCRWGDNSRHAACPR